MLQNVNEENVEHYSHNEPGMPPSTFIDVEDYALRTYNRGAVLANIFERYVNPRTRTLLPRDLLLCTREIKQYLNDLPEAERNDANAAMHIHLEERGYRERPYTDS